MYVHAAFELYYFEIMQIIFKFKVYQLIYIDVYPSVCRCLSFFILNYFVHQIGEGPELSILAESVYIIMFQISFDTLVINCTGMSYAVKIR